MSQVTLGYITLLICIKAMHTDEITFQVRLMPSHYVTQVSMSLGLCYGKKGE